MSEKTKDQYCALDASDESQLTQALTAAIPGIRFVDGEFWPTPQPNYVTDIASATTPSVTVLIPGFHARPSERRHPVEGRGWRQNIEGPLLVLQRTNWSGETARVGRLVAGWSTDEHGQAAADGINQAFRVLKGVTPRRLRYIRDDGSLGGLVLHVTCGEGAWRWGNELEVRRYHVGSATLARPEPSN